MKTLKALPAMPKPLKPTVATTYPPIADPVATPTFEKIELKEEAKTNDWG
ncbi:hypothetical protein [Lactiplantibacillus plantarum]|nr:hypothetical protein [Lactiplantibacillus plantarum]